MKRMDIYATAIDAGFMLSTQYGQAENKLMPVSDGDTLVKFAELILKANPVKQLSDEEIEQIVEKYLTAHAQFIGAGEVCYEGEIEFAKAIIKEITE